MTHDRRTFLRGASAAGAALAIGLARPVGAVNSMVFRHGVASGDPTPDRVVLWIRDDRSDGGDGFYRFTPRRYPDLGEGTLEAAMVGTDGRVTWRPVDPLVPMRAQRAHRSGATTFDGAEGVWYQSGHVYFTTKSDNRVWDLDVAAQHIGVVYTAEPSGHDRHSTAWTTW